jgi:hypothetical protein
MILNVFMAFVRWSLAGLGPLALCWMVGVPVDPSLSMLSGLVTAGTMERFFAEMERK